MDFHLKVRVNASIYLWVFFNQSEGISSWKNVPPAIFQFWVLISIIIGKKKIKPKLEFQQTTSVNGNGARVHLGRLSNKE